jgi:hypothetical protein
MSSTYQLPLEYGYQEHVHEALADYGPQPSLPLKEIRSNREINITLEVRYIQRNGRIVSIPKLGALGRQKKSRNLFSVCVI